MLKYGFELEGFYQDDNSQITIPPVGYPTDGFPGLMEVRTIGAADLDVAYFNLMRELVKYPNMNVCKVEHTFSTQEKRIIRSRHNEKTAVNISNIYNKEPKQLGNRTLASFQINISNQIGYAYTDDKGVKHRDLFELFDYVPIIRALDKEFAKEIKDAGRQGGFYSVKNGCRVEYRSLPNSVFTDDRYYIPQLLKRIQSCVK